MKQITVTDTLHLSLPERIQLVEDIWDTEELKNPVKQAKSCPQKKSKNKKQQHKIKHSQQNNTPPMSHAV